MPDNHYFNEILNKQNAADFERGQKQDDSDLVEIILNVMHHNGSLQLHREVNVNGVIYKPATYILTHVGPAKK